MSFVDNTAYRIFSGRIHKHIDSYYDLQTKLRQSRIPLPVDQYMSSVYLYSILAGIITGIVGYNIGLYLSGKISIATYLQHLPSQPTHVFLICITNKNKISF